METKLIRVDDESVNIIKKFVQDSFETNTGYYKKRNQFDVEKIKQDIYNGKLAEYAVYQFYKDIPEMEINEPDCEIYTAKNKSFEADLFCKYNEQEYHIHVKSQHVEQSRRFGKSWSFQKEDSLTTRPTVKDMICLCSVHDTKTVEIIKPIKASKLVEKYKDPKLEKLKNIKAVLYYEDL